MPTDRTTVELSELERYIAKIKDFDYEAYEAGEDAIIDEAGVFSAVVQIVIAHENGTVDAEAVVSLLARVVERALPSTRPRP